LKFVIFWQKEIGAKVPSKMFLETDWKCCCTQNRISSFMGRNFAEKGRETEMLFDKLDLMRQEFRI